MTIPNLFIADAKFEVVLCSEFEKISRGGFDTKTAIGTLVPSLTASSLPG